MVQKKWQQILSPKQNSFWITFPVAKTLQRIVTTSRNFYFLVCLEQTRQIGVCHGKRGFAKFRLIKVGVIVTLLYIIIIRFLHLHSSAIKDNGDKSLQPSVENVKTASQVSFIVSKQHLCPYKGIHPPLSAILHLKQRERRDPLQHICSPTT